MSKRLLNPGSLLVVLTVLDLTCVFLLPARCETKQLSVAAVCLEFPDVAHVNSLETVKKKAIDDVDVFYEKISYGKIGFMGDVYGWYMMPYPLRNYQVCDLPLSWDDRLTLLDLALSVVRNNVARISEYTYTILVFSGRVWPFCYAHMIPSTHPHAHVEIDNENVDWTGFAHERGHLLGLPDLYDSEKAVKNEFASIVGPWDIMDYNNPSMCAYSRIRLGWVEPNQLLTLRGYPLGASVIISLLELGQGTLAMKLQTYDLSRYYIVEVRQDSWAWGRSMPGGVLVTYVDENLKTGGGIVSVMDAKPSSSSDKRYELFDACFDLWGEGKIPVYFLPKQGAAIVLLGKIGPSYKVGLLTEEEGRQALEAHNSIRLANSSIQKAKNDLRVEGLDKANNTLGLAVLSYGEARFKDSIQLAGAAKALADEATVPKIYYEVKQGIEEAKNRVSQALQQRVEPHMVLEASAALESAKKAFATLQFEQALTYLRKCNDLLSEAERIQTERNQIIASALIAVLLLAAAIVIVRRRRRRSVSAPQPVETNT